MAAGGISEAHHLCFGEFNTPQVRVASNLVGDQSLIAGHFRRGVALR